MRNHLDYPGETGEWEFGYDSEVSNPEMADQEYLSEVRRSRVPLRSPTGFRGRPPVSGVRPPVTGYRPPRPVIRVGGFRPPWEPLPAPPEPSGAMPDEPVEPQSDLIRWVQNSLNRVLHLRLPVDGALGPETRSALRNFQKRAGLPVTGIVDPDAERALRDAVEALKAELTEREWEEETRGGSGDYVPWVQQSLNRILGLRLVEDGIMGPKTRSAIRNFQRRYRLKVDGIVGPITKAALIKAGLPASG